MEINIIPPIPEETDFENSQTYKDAGKSFCEKIFPVVNVNIDAPYKMKTHMYTLTVAAGLEGNFGNIENGVFALNAKVNDGTLQFENRVGKVLFSGITATLKMLDKVGLDFYSKIIHNLPNGASIQFLCNPLKLEFSIFIRQEVKDLIPIEDIQNAEWLNIKFTGEVKINFHLTSGLLAMAKKVFEVIASIVENTLQIAVVGIVALVVFIIAVAIVLGLGIA
ncbi:MAG: hypothetical protein ACRC6T_02150 [Sarcina sp.]